MSARSRRATRRRASSVDTDPPILSNGSAFLPTVSETEESQPVTSTASDSVQSTTTATKKGVFNRIHQFFQTICNAILSFIITVITLPLVPLKHLPSKAYVKRLDVDKVSEMKKELRALERELAKAKRRNSIIAAEKTVIVMAPPAPAALPPPPAPPKMALPPPPPPPPVAGLKVPPKAWRASSSTETGAPTSKPRIKAAVAKKGFDISADQIASIAGRLRKTTDSAPRPSYGSASASKSPSKSPLRPDLGATLRAKMKTRRSSLLQLDADGENKRPTSDENRSPNKNQTNFKMQLRKAPISRSPGGTPLRAQVPATPPIAFNTALADKNVTVTPPRPVDAPVF